MFNVIKKCINLTVRKLITLIIVDKFIVTEQIFEFNFLLTTHFLTITINITANISTDITNMIKSKVPEWMSI